MHNGFSRIFCITQESFEDVIRYPKKDWQQNGQKRKEKRKSTKHYTEN